MSNQENHNKIKHYNSPNFWGMMQNVLITSISKGQFLMGIMGIIMLIIVLKLTPEDTKSLIDDYLKDNSNYKEIKKFSKIHLDIINKFGRFPYRNKVLKRENSKEENESDD